MFDQLTLVIAILPQFILLAANFLMAQEEATLIRRNKPIHHGWWMAAYFGLTGMGCWIFKSWPLALCALFLRGTVFDLFINSARGKPLNYQDAKGTTAITDELEVAIFGSHFWIEKSCYFVLYLASLYVMYHVQFQLV